MNPITVVRLPFTRHAGWKELQRRRPSIPLLAWAIVFPMSLLPPVLLYYAGTHYGDAFVAGFADREWRFITTILFLAELLTFFVMGWLIHAVVNASQHLRIDYQDALVLVIPSLLLNALAVLVALGISCSLVYHGLQALCQRQDEDVETMAATYTIMAAGVLAWGLLMAIIWAY